MFKERVESGRSWGRPCTVFSMKLFGLASMPLSHATHAMKNASSFLPVPLTMEQGMRLLS